MFAIKIHQQRKEHDVEVRWHNISARRDDSSSRWRRKGKDGVIKMLKETLLSLHVYVCVRVCVLVLNGDPVSEPQRRGCIQPIRRQTGKMKQT